MELLESVRLKIGHKILNKKHSRTKRKMTYTNIGSIRTIGIVWDSTNTEQFPHLSGFVREMHDRNIDIQIIGYFPGKILPDEYSAVRYLTCIRRNEINTFYIPVSDEVNAFMNTRLDILIDINFNKIFPLKYISLLSMAGFKIGLSEPDGESSHFDMMMDIRRPVAINEYLENIVYYLEMIKSGTAN